MSTWSKSQRVRLIGLLWLGIALVGSGADTPGDEKWIQLFNGKDLTGWTPKITGYPLGENFADTFTVADGVIKVRYDKYPTFEKQFGHLFYKDKFSNYRVRVEYRFVGDQAKGGPSWATRNSGIMIHCQPPETMRKDQEFPVSIEVQFLGGDGKNARSTGNLCSPGTHVVMDKKLLTRHCTNSSSETFAGDQWVTVEAEVHGDKTIIHKVNGKPVIEYEQAQYDPGDKDAQPFIKDGAVLIKEGYIALQAESHPIEFRKVEILQLKD